MIIIIIAITTIIIIGNSCNFNNLAFYNTVCDFEINYNYVKLILYSINIEKFKDVGFFMC